jgi:hypothetical protein
MRTLPPRSFSIRPLLAGAVLVGTALVAAETVAAPVAQASTHSAVVATLGDFGGGSPAQPVDLPGTAVRPRFQLRTRASRSSDLRPVAVRATALADHPDRDDVWARLRACESGGRYDIDTGNGFYGAYQFHPRTWRNLGYPGLPHEAPPEVQDEAARKLQSRSGWGQWPVCSRRVGAR